MTPGGVLRLSHLEPHTAPDADTIRKIGESAQLHPGQLNKRSGPAGEISPALPLCGVLYRSTAQARTPASSASMSRSLVSGTKRPPITTVASAITTGYQSPE